MSFTLQCIAAPAPPGKDNVLQTEQGGRTVHQASETARKSAWFLVARRLLGAGEERRLPGTQRPPGRTLEILTLTGIDYKEEIPAQREPRWAPESLVRPQKHTPIVALLPRIFQVPGLPAWTRPHGELFTSPPPSAWITVQPCEGSTAAQRPFYKEVMSAEDASQRPQIPSGKEGLGCGGYPTHVVSGTFTGNSKVNWLPRPSWESRRSSPPSRVA